MQIPFIRGIIDRRILLNYRVDPAALQKVLPAPFRPQLVEGWGVAGICLIRLKGIRPWFLPGGLGLSSENAAHRMAVSWDDHGSQRHGVYIPRRDTSSRFNALVGGRLFPGVHHHARFDVHEADGHYHIDVRGDDGAMHVAVEATLTGDWPVESVFGSLSAASAFFEQGSLGYSASGTPDVLDGLELRCRNWSMAPLAVERLASSFFDDVTLFPAGAARFDCALLMRGIEHEWHSRESLCCPETARTFSEAIQLPISKS